MAGDDKTDRFRPVFEPEDIFERFVQNANADRDPPSREDEPTGRTPLEKKAAAGFDREVTVRVASPLEPEPSADKTRPDAPNPFAPAETDTRKAKRLAREQAKLGIYAQTTKVEAPAEDLLEFDEDVMTVPRAKPLRPTGIPLAETKPGPIAAVTNSALGSDLRSNSALGSDLRSDSALGSDLRSDSALGSDLRSDSGQRVVLLTKMKKPSTIPPPPEGVSVSWQSVVAPKGQHTQRLEAMRVVPDVDAARVRKPATPLSEGVEDGQMPTRQLDALLSDMAVLLRYGHGVQVKSRLEELRRTYPEDLLLLRRLAEFHVEHAQTEAALDTLFALAGGLFERRNLEGMRQALEQVLVLAPGNARADRLLSLLEAKREGLGD